MSFEHPAGRHAVKGRFRVDDQGRHWEVSPQATPIGLIVAWTVIANALGIMLAAEAGLFEDPESYAGWYTAMFVALEAPLLAGIWNHVTQARSVGGAYFAIDRVHSRLHLPRDARSIPVADIREVHLLRGWRMIGPHGNRTESPWIELSVVAPDDEGEDTRHVLMSARRGGIGDPTTKLARQLADDLRVPLTRASA